MTMMRLHVWIVAHFVLLLSGTCELDAWHGAFVHPTILYPASRITQIHGATCDFTQRSICSAYTAAYLERAPRGTVRTLMGLGSFEEKSQEANRKPTGLGHEKRGTMSDERLHELRLRNKQHASNQRIHDTIQQRQGEFMAERARAAAAAAQQKRQNLASVLLEQSMQSQPPGTLVIAGEAPKSTMSSGTSGSLGGWEMLGQALADGAPLNDEQLKTRSQALETAKKSIALESAKKSSAKKTSAPKSKVRLLAM